jgi:HSP20 family protein
MEGHAMSTLMEPYAPWLRDLNRLFTVESAAPRFLPPADVLVTDEGVMVYMDVPGLSTEQLDVELENDTLTVRGERPYPYTGEGMERAVRRIERGFGAFERTLRVPRGLDPDAVEASLHDGVLSLRIPKPPTPEPHHIPIRELVSGEGSETMTGQGSGDMATSGASGAGAGETSTAAASEAGAPQTAQS